MKNKQTITQWAKEKYKDTYDETLKRIKEETKKNNEKCKYYKTLKILYPYASDYEIKSHQNLLKAYEVSSTSLCSDSIDILLGNRRFDFLNKDERICTNKDDDLTIQEKKAVLNNTLELLEENINEDFNNKINIFPKVNQYTEQVKNVFDEFKNKIENSKDYNNDNDEDYNHEFKIISLLKKLNRNYIFEYKDKKFYPFIYDIFNTYRYISFEIRKYTPIIKKINQVKGYVEITDRKVKDIIQIKEIFSINQIKNLLYILFNDDIEEVEEYRKLMILLLFKNEKTKGIFTDERINNNLKKLNEVKENTITIYKHFIYS